MGEPLRLRAARGEGDLELIHRRANAVECRNGMPRLVRPRGRDRGIDLGDGGRDGGGRAGIRSFIEIGEGLGAGRAGVGAQRLECGERVVQSRGGGGHEGEQLVRLVGESLGVGEQRADGARRRHRELGARFDGEGIGTVEECRGPLGCRRRRAERCLGEELPQGIPLDGALARRIPQYRHPLSQPAGTGRGAALDRAAIAEARRLGVEGALDAVGEHDDAVGALAVAQAGSRLVLEHAVQAEELGAVFSRPRQGGAIVGRLALTELGEREVEVGRSRIHAVVGAHEGRPCAATHRIDRRLRPGAPPRNDDDAAHEHGRDDDEHGTDAGDDDRHEAVEELHAGESTVPADSTADRPESPVFRGDGHRVTACGVPTVMTIMRSTSPRP
ncbi:MAG: hypothetical protein ACJLS2_04190 [Microcella pacifica]